MTLSADAAASTTGAVYFVDAPALELLSELDFRERAGYQRINLEVWTEAGQQQAVTWIALPGNPYDAGQLPLAQLAEHIRNCHGPSGSNTDYVFQLEQALAELQAPDQLVRALSALLRG